MSSQAQDLSRPPSRGYSTRETRSTLHCQERAWDPAVEVMTFLSPPTQELEAEHAEAQAQHRKPPKDPGKGGRPSPHPPAKSLAIVDPLPSKEANHSDGNGRNPAAEVTSRTAPSVYLTWEDQRIAQESTRTTGVPRDQLHGINQTEAPEDPTYISQQNHQPSSVQGGKAEDGDLQGGSESDCD